jgi:hypothetical protein
VVWEGCHVSDFYRELGVAAARDSHLLPLLQLRERVIPNADHANVRHRRCAAAYSHAATNAESTAWTKPVSDT